MKKNSFYAGIATASALALVTALPVFGEKAPESLLPSNFGQPAAAPPTAPKAPSLDSPPAAPDANPSTQPDTATASPSAKRPSSNQTISVDPITIGASTDPTATAADGEAPQMALRFDVPPGARRSLGQIGILTEASGGIPVGAFATADGAYALSILQHIAGPFNTRWGTLFARKLLASRADTPAGINGADWVAERAWLLLRLGDADVARQLLQQVDTGSYSKRLFEVAMPVYLANADLAGLCPLTDGGAQLVGNADWKMAQPICASLAGEQGRATALLNQANAKRWKTGVDYLLAEKAVGAGTNGRRSVKIEWNRATEFSAWRFGLGLAMGLELPASLYKNAGPQVSAWRAQLPMLPAEQKIASSDRAAALGVLSNRALVDIYSQLLENKPDEASSAKSVLLQTAYSASSDRDRITALTTLWDGAQDSAGKQAMLVLTARAAALVTPDSSNKKNSDQLIAAMMTAGLDRPAARWSGVVAQGSSGWAQLAAGVPDWNNAVSYSALKDFYGNDQSDKAHNSTMLLAGLAGLGRLASDAEQDFSNKLDISLHTQTIWTQAISAAAERGDSGTVGLLALAGMQGRHGLAGVPAYQFYQIIRCLKAVGLEANARMLAAEAVVAG